MDKSSIVSAAESYVYRLLDEKLPPTYVFHNSSHTKAVTDAARKLAKKNDLSPEDTELVTLAALFHDTGYTRTYTGHEDESISIARAYLSETEYPAERTKRVAEVISATKHPQEPKDILQQIMCDADYYHLGQEDFALKTSLLRLEWERALDKSYTDTEWNRNNIDFFLGHKYFTPYAKKSYESGKEKNLVWLQRQLKKSEARDKPIKVKEEKDKKTKDDKDSKKNSDRGIETMFRNAIRTHVEFSGLADNKANIMISINTLIIGGIVTLLLRKLDNNPHLIIPTLMLMTTSMTCIVFAIIAAKPKLSEGMFTRDSIEKKETNLLFFGNFYKMGFHDFAWGMREMMRDSDYLYGSMIKDFYYLGQAVGRKYKYVNICFNIFMFGLIASIIAYIIAVLIMPVKDFNLFE